MLTGFKKGDKIIGMVTFAKSDDFGMDTNVLIIIKAVVIDSFSYKVLDIITENPESEWKKYFEKNEQGELIGKKMSSRVFTTKQLGKTAAVNLIPPIFEWNGGDK